MHTGDITGSLIAWQGWSLVSSATILLLLLIWILAWLLPFPEHSLDAQLDDPELLPRLRARLGGADGLERYRLAIADLNTWLDGWFGAPLSGQAFERCLAIAFVYPVALFLLTLIINALATGAVVAHEVAVFAAVVILGAIAIRYLFRLFFRLIGNLWRFVGGDRDLLRLVARVFLGAAAVIIAFAIAFLIASTVAGAFAEVGTMLLAVLAAFALAVLLAVLIATAGTAATVGFVIAATIAALAVSDRFAFLLMLFFVLLPIVNAILDWLSWAVTRFFLRRVAIVPGGVRGASLLFLELAGDLAAAFMLFVALVALLPNGIEVINLIIGLFGREPFDWQPLVRAAQEAPLTQGLFIFGMLITTLVPTYIHMTIGLAGVLAPLTPGARRAAAALRGRQGQTEAASEGAVSESEAQVLAAAAEEEAAQLEYAEATQEAVPDWQAAEQGWQETPQDWDWRAAQQSGQTWEEAHGDWDWRTATQEVDHDASHAGFSHAGYEAYETEADGNETMVMAESAGAEHASIVQQDEDQREELRPSVRADAKRALLLARLWYIPAAGLAFAFFAGLFLLVSAYISPVGNLLESLALCASSWSHGRCM